MKKLWVFLRKQLDTNSEAISDHSIPLAKKVSQIVQRIEEKRETHLQRIDKNANDNDFLHTKKVYDTAIAEMTLVIAHLSTSESFSTMFVKENGISPLLSFCRDIECDNPKTMKGQCA